jgi:hypothetical protein
VLTFVAATVVPMVAACGSSTAQPPPARSACLLSTRSTTTALGQPVRPSEAITSRAGQQSTCLYDPEGSKPGTFTVDLSWNQKTFSNFRDLHDGHAHFDSGAIPGGETIPPSTYTSVRVGGISAYWLAPEPAPPGSGLATDADQLSATKNGYVVVLISMNLTESQDQRAMAAMLSHL